MCPLISSRIAQVIVILPALQKLRTVTERLKTISSHVTISANNLGELRCVQGDFVLNPPLRV